MRRMREDFPIVFLGDHHGEWAVLLNELDKINLENCFLISVGDCGIGFGSRQYNLQLFEKLNKEFKQKNIYFKAIRGNHDDPSYFKAGKVHLSHFELLQDYTTIKHRNKNIQLIGGAISIDRTGRTEGTSYWKDEEVVLEKDLCKEVDILVTHTAPSVCFPQAFNEMVYSWADDDPSLITELTNERSKMNKIFDACKPKYHFYGHFHSSWSEEVNGCKHRLLNINELCELKC